MESAKPLSPDSCVTKMYKFVSLQGGSGCWNPDQPITVTGKISCIFDKRFSLILSVTTLFVCQMSFLARHHLVLITKERSLMNEHFFISVFEMNTGDQTVLTAPRAFFCHWLPFLGILFNKDLLKERKAPGQKADSFLLSSVIAVLNLLCNPLQTADSVRRDETHPSSNQL